MYSASSNNKNQTLGTNNQSTGTNNLSTATNNQLTGVIAFLQKNTVTGVFTAFIVSTLLFVFVPIRAVQCASLFCSVFIIFSWLYSYILQRSLTIRHLQSELRLARGERFEITLEIENKGLLAACTCFIADTPGSLSIGADTGRGIFFLHKHERRLFRYSISGSMRGLYKAGPIILKASDPVGLFPFTLTFDDYCSVLVRPARIKTGIQAKPGVPQGILPIQNISFEDITRRRSVRPYKSGDELKRINWRLWAKTGSLWTNEYDQTFNCAFFVLLNIALDDYETDKRYDNIEHAVEEAAAVIEKARLLHQKCGIAIYGESEVFIPPAPNMADFILDALALAKPVAGTIEGSDLLIKTKAILSSDINFMSVGFDLSKYHQVDSPEYAINQDLL